MKPISRPQKEALKKLYLRKTCDTKLSYRDFRRKVCGLARDGLVMVDVAGEVFGVEADGHTHS